MARHRQTKEIPFFFQFQSNCQVRGAEFMSISIMACDSAFCLQ